MKKTILMTFLVSFLLNTGYEVKTLLIDGDSATKISDQPSYNRGGKCHGCREH